ncbi:3-hydroxyacyl-CoA dehydrogenase/enoyl-CoA hydratase/3-hydroxybutyryl-CoA epimerase [Mesocricetibacter intestinalis]|uniref:enoyl-CoA hydratase n=1 Tax=Mesocricetibacter intestinalis TaxID=1521930 RepID=A0A4V3DA40_9PAST|nr:3-hydroxyacyl-CoA dehydrogenase NAD-binding domain-containing protein [Mesocricetibacter intestinalis]TDQ59823.1 3-hydroxyacyl-CoA dehydrogenase/enoyl-CoA hydratase/3-hydroxybutyryl-CoA epimerase [Mesocricetibacter intestinalis]
MQQEELQHNDEGQSLFTLEVQDKIGIIRINRYDRDFNLFGCDFIGQLRSLLGAVLHRQLQGLVFISAKPNNFIRGFDLSELENKTPQQIRDFAIDAQALMREIECLRVPVVAAIHGDCYGIGLELALACSVRIATDSASTVFAMPQIRSGILPFAGGTRRLSALLGLKEAAQLLFSGNKIGCRHAQQLGLVEVLTSENLLLQTALAHLAQLRRAPSAARISPWKKLRGRAESRAFIRNSLLERIHNRYSSVAFDNSPARESLLALLKATEAKAALAAEANALSQLFFSEQSQVLRRLEQTTRSMKSHYRARSEVQDIKSVAVLGSGFLGAGIAYLSAYRAGLPVRIKDIHLNEIRKALHQTSLLLHKAVDKGELAPGRMLQIMQLISGGERFIGKPGADFVIEAVYENLALKQQMVSEGMKYFGDNIVYATNTSTLSVKEIAESAPNPANVIGFHYFSPVAERKMLEIIPHEQTSEHTLAKAIHFAVQQGKIPLLVADKPGFFVNRILTPYLLEAIRCVIDGEAIEFVDRSLQEFGFSLGPLAMIDDMGLDVLVQSLPNLEACFGSRFALPERVRYLIENDRKGTKNKRGFYLYHSDSGERSMEDGSIYHTLEIVTSNNLEAEEIVRRCILMMINEACYCWQEAIIASREEGNVASVLGAFFPDFRGGIYAYIDKVGAKNIVAELQDHVRRYGERFSPCSWLLELARQES